MKLSLSLSTNLILELGRRQVTVATKETVDTCYNFFLLWLFPIVYIDNTSPEINIRNTTSVWQGFIKEQLFRCYSLFKVLLFN